MTKKEFTELVSEQLDGKITPKQIDSVISKMVFVLKEQMLSEDVVKLGKLGTFSTVINKERYGINPLTKQTILIPQKRVIRFKPSKYFRDVVGFKK